MDRLVSTEWLANEIGAPDLRVIDATLFLPNSGRNAQVEYEAAHITGAIFMDLDAIVDTSNPVPHMLPSAHTFTSHMERVGIGDDDRLVVYDNSPLHSSARAWWMLKVFGAQDVAILDGGLPKWVAEGRSVESGKPHASHRRFTVSLDSNAVVSLADVKNIVSTGLPDHEIVDARPAARFAGEEIEPRPGVSPGHIPGSGNLPQTDLFNPDNSWKSKADLRAAFDHAGVDLAKSMIVSCGSGVTAATLLFAAHLLGKEDVKLYDGSWAEWGADPSTPKELGCA